jgi:multiple sugar transport system substrate-binding protein/sorbitol/mannitol transport system substrate-binding protein
MLQLMGYGASAAYLAACTPAATPAPTAVPTAASAATPVPAAATATTAATASTEDVNGLRLADFSKANIDWQKFKGVSLGVAMLQSAPVTDLWKDAMKVFEKLSGATVSITELAQNELADRRTADLASKAGTFDVVNTEFELLPGYAKGNLIEPLNPFIDDANLTDKTWLALDDIYKGILDAGAVNGVQYALPVTSESSILSYRKDLVSKAPDTFDDLMSLAQQANKPGEIAGFVARGQRGEGQNVYIWAGFLHGFGGNFFVDFPNDMHPAINSAEAITAAQFYADILQKYGPAGVANYTNEETQVDASNGKAASIIEWSGHPVVIDVTGKTPTAGKWAFAQVPQGPGGRWPSVFSWTFAVNASSKNKEAAWALVQALTAPPASLHNSSQLIIPTRQSVADNPDYQTAGAKLIAGFKDWLPVNSAAQAIAKPDYRPRFPDWSQVGDMVGIALQATISGQQTAKAAFDQAQTDIEKLMKDKGYIS